MQDRHRDALCISVFRPIAYLLVAAEAESLLLHPLPVPVRLGDKQEARACFLDDGDNINPTFRVGNTGNGFYNSSPQARLKSFPLPNVRQCREIGIFTASKNS